MHFLQSPALNAAFNRRTATHSINTDQRRIPLAPTSVAGAAGAYQYSLTLPGDPGIALPGVWMLFALNEAGVPSVSATVRIAVS